MNIKTCINKVKSLDAKIHHSHFLNLKEIFNMSDELNDMLYEAQFDKVRSVNGNAIFQNQEIINEIINKERKLLGDLMEREEIGVNKDLTILHFINELNEDVEKLVIQFNSADNDFINEMLESFYIRFDEIVKQNFYNKYFIEKKLQSCLDKIHLLHFRFLFPIVEEISDYSYQNTFSFRLLDIVKNIPAEAKAFGAFLNESFAFQQKQFIYAFLAKEKNMDISDVMKIMGKKNKITSKDISRSVLLFLQQLKLMTDIAIDLFFHENNFSDVVEKIDPLFITYIEQNLWILKKKTLKNNVNNKYIAIAIMKSISDLINEGV